MHPAAHDEAPLQLPFFREVFRATRAFVFQTNTERRLVERQFKIADRRQIVVGLGVEERSGDAQMARVALGVGDRPFLLCLGRVEDGKGTTMLATFFGEYKRRHPGPLALVLGGFPKQPPPAHPDIIVAGPVDEDVKWGALRASTAVVCASYFEAFSIVLMEAWTAARPAVVNGWCGPLREHSLASGGALPFTSYAAFEQAVERLTGEPHVADRMGRAGQDYVRANFNWPRIISRYGAFLEQAATAAL